MSAAIDIKVAAEVAEAEFERWAAAMDVVSKLDTDAMDDEDRKSFLANKRPIIDAIRVGRLVCNEAGEFVFSPQCGNPQSLTFKEPTGASLMAMDTAGKANHGVAKTFAVLAAITGEGAKTFGLMPNRDLTVCQSILVFLLAK